MTLPIYQSEISDGLADQLSVASVAFTSEAQTVNDSLYNTLFAENVHNSSQATNLNQPDLFYMHSVLVSVGWNANDDVFDPMETWASRNTPVDKQFNFMHNENDIIGHMTSAVVLSPDGKVIANDQQIPETFDIVVGSVLYRSWSDADKQARMNQIIEDIPKDKWFVSMECLFNNFDYALIHDNTQSVIRRNEDSAFLTKHLRVYGGSGEFEGRKLGRVLRNFTFSGKGLVDNPANPRSKIFNKTNPFNGTVASIAILSEETLSKGSNMSDTMESQTRELKAELAELKTANKDLVEKLQAVDAQKFEDIIAGLKQDVANANDTIATLTQEAEAQGKITEQLEADLKEANKKFSEAETIINDMKVMAKKAERLSQLVAVGLDSEKSEELVDKWAEASDDMFGELVELSKSNKDKEDKFDKMKKKDDKSDASEEVDEAEADVDELDEVEAESKADLNSSETDELAEVRSTAASWFSSFMDTTKNLQNK